MALIVQKFGGTSVADTARIKEIIPIIKFEKAQGNKIIVVVSAMAGITNHLITLCNEVSSLSTTSQLVCNEVSSLSTTSQLAEYDTALCSGEMLTAALLALKLQEEKIDARSILAWQLPILTNMNYSKALVASLSTKLLMECINQDIIPIIAGFQGINNEDRLVTLGRGGSDTIASLVAAAMKADRCDIYTDVEGIFTADPRIVPQARKLSQITFEEILEFASSGAKVLHPRAVEVALRYHVSMRVLSSFIINNGTLITSENKIMENRIITGITYNKNLLKVSIENSPISFNHLCHLIATNHIHIELMLDIETNKQYSFIIQLTDKNKLECLLIDLKNNHQIVNFTVDTKIAIVSIIGYGIKNDYSLIGIILDQLEKEMVKTAMIQISEIKISILIKDNDTEKTIRSLHQ